MATFELQGPDGGTYQVDAPDPQTAFAALHGGPSAPASNPFNRQMGSDVSFGSPLSSPTPTPPLDRAGELRAMMGGPITDRGAAALQTFLPESIGGTGQDYSANLAGNRAATSAAQAAHPAAGMAGDIAGTIPYAALGPEGIAGAAGVGAAAGAAGSPDWSNISETAKDALIGGGIGGGLGVAGRAIGRAITPFEPNANRLALTAALSDAGINPTAGQVTGNQGLQKLEAGDSDIPFAGGGANAARVENNRAFTSAMMEKAGAPPGQIATPENLNALHANLGGQFDALGARNSIPVDPQLTAELNDAVSGYHDLTGTPAPGVEKTATPLMDTAIPGDKYNSVRSQLGRAAQALRFSDPPQSQAYRDIQDALDSGMERSIFANNPSDLGAFQDVRSKYKNLVPIEQAAGSAGADAASGIISPQQMRTALASGNNRRAYARGIGDLAPLTNAGNAILTNVPQSGTAPRLLAAALLHGGVGPGLGAVAAGIPGAVGGVALPALAGRAIMSRPVQAYLKNQVAPGIGRSEPTSALAKALAAAAASSGAGR